MAVTLSVHQEMGQIGIKTQPRQFELRRTPSDVTIERTDPEIDLSYEPGQISIDWTPVQNSVGYGNVEFFLQNVVAEARQVFESDLERTVSAGDALAQLSKKVTFSQLAAQAKYFDHPVPDPYLAYIEPAEIHFEPGQVTHNGQPGQLKLSASMGKVEMSGLKLAVVDIYVEQEPVLEIAAKGWAFDFEV